MRSPIILAAVLLLATACTAPDDARDDAMAERLVQVEARVAQLEAGITGSGSATAGGAPSTSTPAPAPAGAAASEKEQFAQATARDQLEGRLAAVAGIGEVRDVRFDEATDTLVVDAAADEDPGEAAWQAAQELSDLWSALSGYQPVLDLRIGEVRCACSAVLMKAVASGAADRAAWEVACQGA